jgi:hypothetical protein
MSPADPPVAPDPSRTTHSPIPSALPAEVVRRQLVALLREGVEGPRERWSYFTDHGASAGFLGTLEPWSAAEISHPGEGGGATVAGHVHHVIFGMEASMAFIRGDRTPRNWGESWDVTAVDPSTWAMMQERLRETYTLLLQTLQEADLTTDEAFGGAVAAIAHVAYHLGAIRQRRTRAAPDV